jgi:Fic family protein
LRDITELLERGMLQKLPGGGRRTGYTLADTEPQ